MLWILFQLVPLPPPLVGFLSPRRLETALAARSLTGSNLRAWLPLSVSPAATLENLLNVAPAMAAFVAARQMGLWWTGPRAWIVVAPVIAVAVIESFLGLGEFYSFDGSANLPLIRGTYVNRNHFAGLLELALPLAIMWAVDVWERGAGFRGARSTSVALGASLLLFAAAVILAAVSASLSRMGFIASLAAIGVVTFDWLRRKRERSVSPLPKWLSLVPILVPVLIFIFLSTNAMVLRFASGPEPSEMTADGRVLIWQESLQLIRAYPWTGTGLGAYEYGLYPFRTHMLDFTIDYAHNDYLQIFAELGLLGGALVMALAVWILSRTLPVALERARGNWALAVGLLGSFVAIGLHSLVDFNLYVPANALAVAWLAGTAASPGLRERG